MDIFKKGANWEADRAADLAAGRKRDRFIITVLALCLLAAVLALVLIQPLRRTVPYLIQRDSQTGAVEVLQAFDNRVVGSQEALNIYWARRYVNSREQYNWYLIAQDYDTIASMTEKSIFKDYADQYLGDKGLDKVFGDFTERRINILGVTPSPTNPNQMVVRFERTTVSKGSIVEPPTIYVVNMTYRYVPNSWVTQAELTLNPVGYQVFAYRRDVEVPASATPAKPQGGAQGSVQGGVPVANPQTAPGARTGG
jgi:type IV secretion system protein VirB8